MRSSPFIQLSLDLFSTESPFPIASRTGSGLGASLDRFIDSRGVMYIYLGSGYFGATRHYISSDGFPWTLDLKKLVFRKSPMWQNTSPALKARGSKSKTYLIMSHKSKMCYVHRIVAQYFLNDGQPIPPGMQVDHLDSNIYNNAVSNLEIVTAEENNRRRNLKHGYKHMSAHARAGAARRNRKRYARIHATLTTPERPPVEAGGSASA